MSIFAQSADLDKRQIVAAGTCPQGQRLDFQTEIRRGFGAGQERGLNVLGVLGMLVTFNLVYMLVSTPAGSLSDRIGRRTVIVGGWLVYAVIYLGFALAGKGWHVWALYAIYGVYYGLAYGTAKAMVADIVPVELRGTAYGTYNAVLGIIDFPASLIAGILWDGAFGWSGFGPSAPFFFGSAMALIAAVAMWIWKPTPAE